jgi:rRNA maturation RNase YbeY
MPAAASIAVVHDHPTRHLSEDRLRACVEALLETEGATLVDLSIVLTDHDTVHRLNREYLSHDYPTDVLSFSLRTPKEDADEASPIPVDGEVYVDLDTAAERCAEFNATFEDEALRYVLHGVLHLVGYDDSTAAGREQMRAREDRYLRAAAPDA